MAMPCEVIEQLGWYQMNLTEIWSAWIAASEVTMTDMLSRVCIALYAVAFDEMDHFTAGLAVPRSSSILLGPSGRLRGGAPLLPKISRYVRKRHRVQYTVGRYATLPGHLDTPMHVIQLPDRVRIRIDAHHASEIERRLMPSPVEVEPPWMGIDLDDNVVLRASAKHLLDIDFVPRAALKLPASHVTDDCGEGVGDRSQQAVGLGFPVHLEPAVNAGDHKVESGQYIIGIVQRPVRQDVGFDSLQDPEFLPELFVEPVGLPVLLLNLLHREPAGIMC
jgi:hypothetical protein